MSETKDVKKATIVEMEAGIKQIENLDAEIKRVRLERELVELEEVKERTANLKLKREQRELDRKTKGQVLRQQAANDAAAQSRCNHKKGGNGSAGVLLGQGDDSQYAVLKHTFCNGDTWVRCLRCGKTWKPPIESDFYFDAKGVQVAPKDGKFSEEAFLRAQREHREALAFQTRNNPSSSVMFKFSDGGKFFREIMKGVTLR